jgi:S1-C subfamily serine protease
LPDSPAAKAGLQKGDIILKVNDIKINLDHPLLYVLYTFLPGDTVELLIDRKGQLIKKEITL